MRIYIKNSITASGGQRKSRPRNEARPLQLRFLDTPLRLASFRLPLDLRLVLLDHGINNRINLAVMPLWPRSLLVARSSSRIADPLRLPTD